MGTNYHFGKTENWMGGVIFKIEKQVQPFWFWQVLYPPKCWKPRVIFRLSSICTLLLYSHVLIWVLLFTLFAQVSRGHDFVHVVYWCMLVFVCEIRVRTPKIKKRNWCAYPKKSKKKFIKQERFSFVLETDSFQTPSGVSINRGLPVSIYLVPISSHDPRSEWDVPREKHACGLYELLPVTQPSRAPCALNK